MIKKLLFLLLFGMFSTLNYAQVVANPVPNIFQCQNQVFDLTTQIPTVLGSQSPAQYSVSFYMSSSDASIGVNAIPNPSSFMPFATMEIFIRVTNDITSEFDLTSFVIVEDWLPIIEVSDVLACENYTLPTLPSNMNYYTMPNGGGTIIPPGFLITESTTIYVHASNGTCQADDSFEVTIGNVEMSFAPLIGCSSSGSGFATFDLGLLTQQLEFAQPGAQISYYETMTDAENQTSPLNVTYNNFVPFAQTIYVGYMYECYSVYPLQLVVESCTTNTISGVIRYDADQDGCQSTDGFAANLQITNASNGIVTYAYTNAVGAYSFTNVQAGSNVLTVQGLASGSVVNPVSQSITVTGTDNNYNADFCVTGPTPFTDVGVQVQNINNAVPGFALNYRMTVHSLGNTTASGSATFTYDSSMITFNSASFPVASSTANSVTFNYSSLVAYNQETFDMNFMVLPPPIVNSGDILNVSAIVTSLQTDQNLTNNATNQNLTVVNSFDPNDISVSEGQFITESQVDDYLHYIIRFQNLGTGPAVNIRVENALSSFLDWSTFMPLGASHNSYVIQRNGGDVTFQFDNINLPASQTNEAGSHGFIMYKIKPISTLQIGNVISNTADIFFDFNSAVTTNTITTQIQQLSVNQNLVSEFIMYPNPAQDFVNVRFDAENAVISIVDLQGKIILSETKNLYNNETSVDVSALESGMYFVQISSGQRSVIQKLLIK